ncbi:MAG: AMP-binding protein, partial [Myxococcota bacterium]
MDHTIHTTLAAWAHHHAKTRPTALALATPDGPTHTWQRLDHQARRLAAGLHRRGVSIGDRVLLGFPNHTLHLEALLACAHLGAICVPLNTRWSAPEAHWALEHAQPRAVLLDSERAAGWRWNLDPARDLVLEEDAYTALTSSGAEPPEVDVDPDWPAVMLYTSGTTRRSKGVLLSHRNLASSARQFVQGLGLTASDVNYAVAPLFHTAGLGVMTLPLMAVGGASVIATRFEPEAALRAMADSQQESALQCTCAFMVPTMWYALAHHEGMESLTFDRFRLGVVGGAPCPQELRERLNEHGLPLAVGYGMTEAAPMGTLLMPDQGHPDSVGQPGPQVELQVMDAEGQPAPLGTAGEVVLRGPNIMCGYWRNEEATRAAFAQGGWLRTGDIGWLDTEGFLTLVDRREDMIISGGENIYPSEVESVLEKHPKVAEVAVIGTPEPRWGEVVTAVVVAAQGEQVVLEELREWAAQELGRFKLPKRLVHVALLPRG